MTIYRIVFSEDEIVEICKQWDNYNGFRGEGCFFCKSSVNMLLESDDIDISLRSNMWLCPKCGSYNYFSAKDKIGKPYKKPMFGVPLETILKEERIALSFYRFSGFDEIFQSYNFKENTADDLNKGLF